MNKKLLIQKLLACCFLAFTAFSVYAQQTVTGVISDQNGEPLLGVSILVKGTSIGTTTDLDGTFSLEVPSDNVVLEVSYLGYKTEKIQTSVDDNYFQISMLEDINQLDEVVVTGLASGVKRSNSGNSVASVSAEQLMGTTGPQTLDNALFGKIAGVQMSANGGAPGGGVSVQLRGVSTLGAGSSQPLYIIDGVYVNNTSIRTGRTQVNGASGGQNAATQDDAANRIADLNPDDIERIEVLKGASAAAIYGTRANAGVIIITTKRGKAGETKISFSQDIGTAQGQNLQNFGIWDAARTTAAKGESELPALNAAISEGRNIDWEQFFYGDDALLSNTQLSISGGTDKTQFYVSGGMKKENGIIKNTGFDRYSIRANLDHALTKKIRFGISSTYSKTDNDRGFTGNQNNTGGSIGYALAYTPSYANLLPDANGNYPNNPYFNDNPIAIRDLGVNNQKVDRFITSATLDYDVMSDDVSFLKFKVNAGVDYLSGNSLVYFPEILQHQRASANPGDVMWGRQDDAYTNLQAFLTYNRQMGSINSNTSIGAVRLDQESEFLLTRGRGLSGGQTNLQWAKVQSIQGQSNSRVTDIGYVIQEDLNYDDKLIASIGLRMDRSTLNADQEKFYAFPKASLAANLHNFGLKKDGILDRLKARIAYGQTGGLPNFGVTFEALNSQLVGGQLGGQVGARGVDPNLSPETSTELEFGIDAGFFNERISLEATVYNKQVKNLIFDQVPPESTGILAIATNAGDLENRGIELSLGINSIRSANINMQSNIIFSRNRSKLTRWDVPAQTTGGFGPSLGTYLFAEGYSPTAIVGTPSGTELPLGFTPYGDRQPDFSMALSNNLRLGDNLEFSFLFHYQKGGRAINLSALLWDDGGTTPNWDGDDDGDGTPNGLDRLLEWAVDGNTGVYVQPTSYVKLREIGLYYTLPKGIFGSGVKGVKVGVSANNMLLWTNYDGYDPEVSNFGVQAVTGNIDVTPYPSSRRLFFHVKADF